MTRDELLSALPELLMKSSSDKPFTMPCIFGKQYGENFISDWLSFVLNPDLNGLGNKPLEILLELAKESKNKRQENIDLGGLHADLSDAREFQLEKDARIDFLIPVFDMKNSMEIPEYYIAIENKIFADEGDSQTKKYYDYISQGKKCNKPESNVYIFLCVKEQKLTSEHFKCVTYDRFIERLKELPLNFINDIRRAFLFQEFIIHIQEYVVGSRHSSITDINFKLLEYAQDIIREYNKKEQIDAIDTAYGECIKARNVFFAELQKKIQSSLNEDEWIVKTSSKNQYIQIYKNEWKKHSIHYEFIIEKQTSSTWLEKSIPYPDCNFLLMIHYEASADKEKLKSSLPCSISNIFGKKSFSVYEERIDTALSFKNSESINDLIIKADERLSKLIKKTESIIDDYVKNLN